MLVTLLTVQGALWQLLKLPPRSQFPFCFRVSTRVVFSFVLFLLHRHVLGRSLEHPHARIHGSGFPVLVTLDLWLQAQHQHQHAAPPQHQHAASPSLAATSFLAHPVLSLLFSSTAPPLVRTIGHHRLYSGSLRASRHACQVLTALQSPPLSHPVRGFLSLLHHFFAAISYNTRTVPSAQPMFLPPYYQLAVRGDHLITNGRYVGTALLPTGGTWGPPYYQRAVHLLRRPFE